MKPIERILPAYPLFVKDPNFSLWCTAEALNGSNVQSWWGEEKKIYGFLKSGGETYCFLGRSEDFACCGVKSAEQVSLTVTAFTTEYGFQAGKARLKLRFVSPLLPTDLEMISQPVCYLAYEIEGDPHAEISLFCNRGLAYNDGASENGVRGGVAELGGFESAFMGLKRQRFLSNNGDGIGADWGYWYLAGEKAYILDETDLAAYLAGGLKAFANAGEERYIGAMNGSKEGVFLLGYDDIVSIDYFGDFRKGYYLQSHTIVDALQAVWTGYGEIDRKLFRFDGELKEKAKPFGSDYLPVLYASLRQSISSHKLVKDGEGNVLYLSKECDSNGCIATVDVSYPSIPLFLVYNPELVKGMMRPILKFAKMPVWNYDFAPHDAGTYPHCCGNVYGLSSEKNKYMGNLLKEGNTETWFPFYLLPESFSAYDLKYQMPVEECANLLVMWFACYRQDGDLSFFREYFSLAEKWVEYLVKFGLKPENQLCTDDFAGHLKNNLNLSIKATVGIACYAELLKEMGKQAEGKKYRKIAEEFAAEIVAFGKRYSHLPISWDEDDETFSLKYNLAFDKILQLGLFPQELLEREVDCYLEKADRFGTPLDHRERYTKSDWLVWVASLTDDTVKREKMLSYLNKYLKESPTRVPFSDWYRTDKGEFIHFRARTVQGGCFMLLMK